MGRGLFALLFLCIIVERWRTKPSQSSTKSNSECYLVVHYTTPAHACLVANVDYTHVRHVVH